MAKLNQILPIIKTAQVDAEQARTKSYQALQKSAVLTGLVRTYQAKDDDGDKLPEEKTLVQLTVPSALDYALKPWQRLMNIVFERDVTNREAVADLKINGKLIAKDVPTTYLLWLEKELHHLHTLISKLPRLDPAQNWSWDSARGFYVSDEVQTERSVKVPKAFVKYEATDKHPAQVETFTEAQVVGYWTKQDFSGAIPADQADAMLARVREVQEAVTSAIFEANAVEVRIKGAIGGKVFDYVLAGDSQTPSSNGAG